MRRAHSSRSADHHGADRPKRKSLSSLRGIEAGRLSKNLASKIPSIRKERSTNETFERKYGFYPTDKAPEYGKQNAPRSSSGGGGSKIYSSTRKTDKASLSLASLTGMTRTLFILFFAFHIPITLFLNSQAIFPADLYPPICQDAMAWYGNNFKDSLFAPPFENMYVKSFVACEVFLQLPFFVLALYALVTGKIEGSGWFRQSCIAYGAHASTTTLAMIWAIAYDGVTTDMQKRSLFVLYLPYLVFPFWLTVMAAKSDDVFAPPKPSQNIFRRR